MAEKQGQQPGSIENPMPSLVNADRVIDELFGNNPNQKIPLDKIMDAESKASVAPDVITYFRRIANQAYTKRELIDALNSCIRERHREPEVGLFGVGRAEQEARQEQRQQKQA